MTYNKPHTELKAAIAARARRIRLDRKKNQEYVAKHLGLSTATYTKWENRGSFPSWAFALLAELYGAHAVMYILTGRIGPPEPLLLTDGRDEQAGRDVGAPAQPAATAAATAAGQRPSRARDARSQADARRKPPQARKPEQR